MLKRLLVLLCIALLVSPCCISSVDADDGTSLLRISAVYPTSSAEGFALTNYGSAEINLKEYSLSDGEGTVTFTEDIKVSAGEKIFILKDSAPIWIIGSRCYVYGSDGICSKNFILNDNGDEIYLKKGNIFIDSVIYGNGHSDIGNWKGDPLDKIPKNKIAERITHTDTDTSADWTIHSVGLETSEAPEEGYGCSVIPFTFPESKGSEVLWALYNAQSSVDISVYLINHPDVISVLKCLLDKGVCVRILVEGSPAGGINESELSYLSLLFDHGAHIKLMKSGDYGRRYTYLHNKYAIIDNNRTIITSENWQRSSFESNIGWGVVIDSADYAGFMTDVFEKDYNGFDTCFFRNLYKNIKSASVLEYTPEDTFSETYTCIAYPILSPDYSWDSVREFIYGAQERLYIEQLEIDYHWVESEDNPLQWAIETAETGVCCKLLLDGTFDDDSDIYTDDSYGLISLLYDTPVLSKINENSNLLHNKGLISDDKVWVGSVNWTDTSLCDNRETAVIIESSDVSAFFINHFNQYWGEEMVKEVNIKVDYDSEVISGSTVLLDASDSTVKGDAVFKWEIDGVTERTGKKIPVVFSSGMHKVVLTVYTGDDEYSEQIEINSVEKGPDIQIPWKYLPFLVICIIVIIRYLITKYDDGKGVQKKGRNWRL